MSREKSNRPTDRANKPSARLNPQIRTDEQESVNKDSRERNRNQEHTSQFGRENPAGQSELSTEPWQQETSPQLKGERTNESKERKREGVSNQSSSGIINQQNPNALEGNRAGRSYTGNSERSGQQYSEEEGSSDSLDWQDQQYRGQNNDQQDKSHGTEYSAEERRKSSRGMNAPGMENDQEMNHPRDRKKSGTDEKSDLKDGAE